MPIDQVKDAVGRWVTAQGSKPVWQLQNSPQPAGAYVALLGPRLVREMERTEVIGGHSDPTMVTELTGIVYAVYIDFSARSRKSDSEAYQTALDLHKKLQTPAARRVLAPLVIVDLEEVQQIPLLTETQFKGRADFTARFRMTEEVTGAVEAIRSVSAEGEVDTHTVTLEVSA